MTHPASKTLLGLLVAAAMLQPACNSASAPAASTGATSSARGTAAAGGSSTAPVLAAAPSPDQPVTLPPAQAAAIQKEYFSDWPAGANPLTIGDRVANNVLPRGYRYENHSNRNVIYPEIIAWYGALTFAKVTKNVPLQEKLIRKFDYFLTEEGATHIGANNHVDYRIFGTVPLEIYMTVDQSNPGAAQYRTLGLGFADRQWQTLNADGISNEARYWVDDMYMLPIIQLQAYRVTKDKTYLDRTAKTMAIYLERIQKENGLFWHGPDAPYFWSRGNGWIAAGMAELLRDLPPSNPDYPAVMAGYKKMMDALLKTQGTDGLWKQLMDHPEAWSETSGSAMFIFALVTGVKNGWLDAKTFGPPARKAWIAQCALIDEQGQLSNICPGTNKWVPANGDGVLFYLNRPPLAGPQLATWDALHGMAPTLWSATALLR